MDIFEDTRQEAIKRIYDPATGPSYEVLRARFGWRVRMLTAGEVVDESWRLTRRAAQREGVDFRRDQQRFLERLIDDAMPRP